MTLHADTNFQTIQLHRELLKGRYRRHRVFELTILKWKQSLGCKDNLLTEKGPVLSSLAKGARYTYRLLTRFYIALTHNHWGPCRASSPRISAYLRTSFFINTKEHLHFFATSLFVFPSFFLSFSFPLFLLTYSFHLISELKTHYLYVDTLSFTFHFVPCFFFPSLKTTKATWAPKERRVWSGRESHDDVRSLLFSFPFQESNETNDETRVRERVESIVLAKI